MSQTPGPVGRWVSAARPRTLPAALVPVAVGAATVGHVAWLNSALAGIVALGLQIATNFANDYADGVRGTDAKRVGPFRLTASGLVPPARVRAAAAASFAVAAVAGLVLSARASWWLVALGATAILAGYFYTGGPRPYGYLGLGELFVLIYFGFVATVGTAFVQHRSIPPTAWWLGLTTGAMACALLEANNLRDAASDRAAGKLTLAARLGRRAGGWLYVVWVLAAVGGLVGAHLWWAALAALLVFVPAWRLATSSREGRALLPLLAASARGQLLVGACAVIALRLTLP